MSLRQYFSMSCLAVVGKQVRIWLNNGHLLSLSQSAMRTDPNAKIGGDPLQLQLELSENDRHVPDRTRQANTLTCLRGRAQSCPERR